MGKLCNKFGLTEIFPIDTDDGITDSRAPPTVERHRISEELSSPPVFVPTAQSLAPQEMSISLKTPDSEELRSCHVCSTPSWSPTHCTVCGHPLCERCTCEASSNSHHAHGNAPLQPSPPPALGSIQPVAPLRPKPNPLQSQSIAASMEYEEEPSILASDSHSISEEGKKGPKTARATQKKKASQEHRQSFKQRLGDREKKTTSLYSIKENPFLVQDRKGRTQATSQVIPDTTQNHDECDDPTCRATHDGHFPVRHSISCPKHQSEQVEQKEIVKSEKPKKPKESQKSQKSSAELVSFQDSYPYYHHAADFHDDQHIIQHLSSAIGRDASDILKEREAKESYQGSSKPSIAPKLQPEPELVSEVHSETKIGQPQQAQVIIPPEPPVDSHDEQQATSTASQARRIGDVPKQRINTPPHWLKNPTNEAANAKARLRPVNAKLNKIFEHHLRNLSSIPVDEGREKKIRHSKSSDRAIRTKNSSIAPIVPSITEHEVNRTACPSPDTAMHVTRHQTAQNWLDLPREQCTQSRALREVRSWEEGCSSRNEITDVSSMVPGTTDSAYLTPRVFVDEGSSHHGYSNVMSVMPQPGARVSSLHHSALAHSASKAPQTFKERNDSQDEHLCSAARTGSNIREATHWPLQPHYFPQDVDESVSYTTHLRSEFERKRSGLAVVKNDTEPEIATPMPIAPPNHKCSWTERYRALTGEIRELKAEISSQHSFREANAGASLSHQTESSAHATQDHDDLCLQGVTIILHSKHKDDIVIDTDLNNECDSNG
ncbi:hypothetical protein F5Y16DRAFT_360670 [Xylariaceae sp. FL0255]|nr:hypothetical protein F5Y16DRAFT_360670 [Xylariaceae sp. FL0255]